MFQTQARASSPTAAIKQLARQWRASAPATPHASTFRYLRELIDAHGLDATIADGQAAIFDRAIAAGHVDDDFAVLSRFMKKAR